MPDPRDVTYLRQEAQDTLMDYAVKLREWNAPDDEHTRLTLHQMVEAVIAEAVPE